MVQRDGAIGGEHFGRMCPPHRFLCTSIWNGEEGWAVCV